VAEGSIRKWESAAKDGLEGGSYYSTKRKQMEIRPRVGDKKGAT